MKRSLLGAVALGAGGAAVAGFGAAAGRDVYKSVKKSTGLIILLVAIAGAVCLPFLGMRNLFRGYAPGDWWKGIGDILLVPLGIVIGIGLALFAGTLMGEEPMAMILVAIGAASFVGAIVGVLIGLFQRPKTQRRHAISTRNEQFLTAHRIRETGEAEITHRDAEGNALRLMERTPSSIVFMAVGHRNKRAYIGLSNEGEMTTYSGVIPLNANRDMDTASWA